MTVLSLQRSKKTKSLRIPHSVSIVFFFLNFVFFIKIDTKEKYQLINQNQTNYLSTNQSIKLIN